MGWVGPRPILLKYDGPCLVATHEIKIEGAWPRATHHVKIDEPISVGP